MVSGQVELSSLSVVRDEGAEVSSELLVGFDLRVPGGDGFFGRVDAVETEVFVRGLEAYVGAQDRVQRGHAVEFFIPVAGSVGGACGGTFFG